MLPYAADRLTAASRHSSPNALLLIVSAHVALVAAVMSAKMDLPRRFEPGPPLIKVRLAPPPPPPHVHVPARRSPALIASVDAPSALHAVTQPPPLLSPALSSDATPGNGPAAAVPGIPINLPAPPAAASPARHEPRLLTEPSELKPPYPAAKLASEEEANLHLRLTIDDRGRVIAVDPIGSADPVFLEAARRYIIAHWRYEPATEDGRSVGATIAITLHFELEG